MRPLDELARLWNDARSRLPQGLWPPVSWSWPLAAVAGAAMFALIGTSWSDVPTSHPNLVAAAAVSPPNCQDQTWPFISDGCLRRHEAAGARATPVRVIRHEPAMAAAAIGATQWAYKPTPFDRKQASRNPDRSVTVRSGRKSRNAAPQRIYVVPGDSAYRAYGYAPR